MIRMIIVLTLLVSIVSGYSQTRDSKILFDFSAGIGSSRGTLSFSGSHQWYFGKKNNFRLGAGLRYTGFAGANLHYITAPAKLTSGDVGPLVIFKENVTDNIDSLVIKSPQVHALNIELSTEYKIFPKFVVGFNIDLAGFTFGGRKTATYINGDERKNIFAKPTTINKLLVSDNDIGTLNSELFVRYAISEKWALKCGGQFLFTEYTTETDVQQYPEPNNRFRNKSLLFTTGATLKF
jgi:hypothetical protein